MIVSIVAWIALKLGYTVVPRWMFEAVGNYFGLLAPLVQEGADGLAPGERHLLQLGTLVLGWLPPRVAQWWRILDYARQNVLYFPFWSKVKVLVAVLSGVVYVLSPIDLIPEAVIPVIGLIDDLVAIIVALTMVISVVRRLLVRDAPPPRQQ